MRIFNTLSSSTTIKRIIAFTAPILFCVLLAETCKPLISPIYDTGIEEEFAKCSDLDKYLMELEISLVGPEIVVFEGWLVMEMKRISCKQLLEYIEKKQEELELVPVKLIPVMYATHINPNHACLVCKDYGEGVCVVYVRIKGYGNIEVGGSSERCVQSHMKECTGLQLEECWGE